MTTFNNENFRAVVMLDANVQSSKKSSGCTYNRHTHSISRGDWNRTSDLTPPRRAL